MKNSRSHTSGISDRDHTELLSIGYLSQVTRFLPSSHHSSRYSQHIFFSRRHRAYQWIVYPLIALFSLSNMSISHPTNVGIELYDRRPLDATNATR